MAIRVRGSLAKTAAREWPEVAPVQRLALCSLEWEPLPEFSGGGVKRRVGTKTPAERGVDSWLNYGEEGIWKRTHRTSRRALFTPHRVAGRPRRDVVIGGRRTTIGSYVGSGKKFEIVDDYHDPHHAQRILADAWIGTSEFRVMNVDGEDGIVETQISERG